SEWVSDHRRYPFRNELPAVRDSLALLAMFDIMDQTDNEYFGRLDELDYTLSASGSADVESLKNLHRLRWIAPTPPATIGDFAFHDNNTVRGVYITQVPW